MKSKKGFTLIELLAIIVILAIIAVITVPIILNIIEEAQLGAAKDSAYGFKDSINKYYLSESVKDPDFYLEDGTYTVSESNGSAVLKDEETYIINLSGTVPTGGYIIIEDNEIVGGNIQIGNYCIDLSNMNITKGSCGDIPIAQATPETCFEREDNGDNTVTITGYTCGVDSENEILDVVIPNKLDGQNVTIIGGCAFYKKQITSVKIPDSVITIREQAFFDNRLTSVEIPDSVTSIGWWAFSLNSLESVEIPNSVTTILEYAFQETQLKSITIPNSVTSIGENAFEDNPGLTINVIGYSSKPSGWSSKWNIDNYPVNWNYQG